MTKKKRLGDLFQIGKEVAISEPGDDEPVVVWLQKLNSVDLDTAWRKANAARARLLSAKSDHDSEDYQAAVSEILSMGEEDGDLISYVIAPERGKILSVTQAELAAEEEWANEEYLQGLQDAWRDGLNDTFARDSEDPEAKRVWLELQRFADAVDANVKAELENKRAVYEGMALEDLRDEAVKLCLEYNANSVWAAEYNRTEVWLGTRESDDHSKRYFVAREEVDQLAPPVLGRLRTEFESMRVDILEGKGSPETRDSSPSSEQPVEEETPDSSGLVSVSP